MECIDWQQIVSPSHIGRKQIILRLDRDQFQAVKTADKFVERIDCIIAQMSKMEANRDLKKQRTILDKMKIEIPVEANLVIKRAGI
jgi:hypothetical protein